jgi:hypothetical protein
MHLSNDFQAIFQLNKLSSYRLETSTRHRLTISVRRHCRHLPCCRTEEQDRHPHSHKSIKSYAKTFSAQLEIFEYVRFWGKVLQTKIKTSTHKTNSVILQEGWYVLRNELKCLYVQQDHNILLPSGNKFYVEKVMKS